MPRVEMDTITTANMTEFISTPRKRERLPDSPVEAARQRSEEPNGYRHPADVLSIRMDMQSIRNASETAANEAEQSEHVKRMRKHETHQICLKTRRVSIERWWSAQGRSSLKKGRRRSVV